EAPRKKLKLLTQCSSALLMVLASKLDSGRVRLSAQRVLAHQRNLSGPIAMQIPLSVVREIFIRPQVRAISGAQDVVISLDVAAVPPAALDPFRARYNLNEV